MKKADIPQGNNPLSKAIEAFMTMWGGTKYQKATLQELQDDLVNRIDPILKEEKGAVQVMAANLKRRAKTKKTKEDLLMDANETLFKFFEGTND